MSVKIYTFKLSLKTNSYFSLLLQVDLLIAAALLKSTDFAPELVLNPGVGGYSQDTDR